MKINHNRNQHEIYSEIEWFNIDIQKKKQSRMKDISFKQKERNIFNEMRIDVFVINASNTNHEMNTQKTKSDFVENVEAVKNAKTKHIVNIDWIDDMQKTKNTESKKENWIFETRFIFTDRFEKLLNRNRIDDILWNQSQAMMKEESAHQTITTEKTRIAWDSQSYKRKLNSWLKKKKKKSQSLRFHLTQMKMMKNTIIRADFFVSFFQKKICVWYTLQ